MEFKRVIVCGDSFSIGIGCHNLETEPYGSLLRNHLGCDLINLAKGSSTNFSIYLQAKYAAERLANTNDLVIVSNTSYDRVEWFPLDYDFPHGELENTDVNYHQYPPYFDNGYIVNGTPIVLNNPMANDPDYTGAMYTENYVGVIDYWEKFGSTGVESAYYKRFDTEPKKKIKALYDFATIVHEPRINRIYSIGVLTLAHELLKRANVKHLILTHEPAYYKKFINEENLANVDWGQLSLDYPDDLPSWHTSHLGHVKAFEIVLDKLKENKWI
jgi:hypothetical protein